MTNYRYSNYRTHGYCSSALTGLGEAERARVLDLNFLLKEKLAQIGIGLYLPQDASDPEDPHGAALSAEEVYVLDRLRVAESSFVIVNGNLPSFGAGQELEMALALSIPVVVFREEGESLSRMVRGTPANFIHLDNARDLPDEQIIWYAKKSSPEETAQHIVDLVVTRVRSIVEAQNDHSWIPPFRVVHKLQSIMDARGYSIEQLAKESGIAASIIKALFRSHEELYEITEKTKVKGVISFPLERYSFPSLWMFRQLCGALRVSMEEILKDTSPLALYLAQATEGSEKAQTGDSERTRDPLTVIETDFSEEERALLYRDPELAKVVEELVQEADDLEKRTQQLKVALRNRTRKPQTEAVEANARYKLEIDKLRSPKLVGKPLSYKHIENIVRNLQIEVWENRHRIWKEKVPENKIDVLDPAVVFDCLGYHFEVAATLGHKETYNGIIEVAGYIDKSEMYAGVSAQFPPQTRNFTAAHELGHAFLHDASGLHRDRPLDGSSLQGPRPRVEREADKFASYFLMPEKIVRDVFADYFSTERFTINEDTAFALIGTSSESLKSRCRTLRDLARILASAEHYGGRFFNSIASRFHVSIEAMAIRLEELELLEF